MTRSMLVRRGLIGTAGVLVMLFALVVLLAAALQAGFFRNSLIRFIASQAGRAIAVDGRLEVRLLTTNPRLTAERVTVGNPAWVPKGPTAVIGRLSIGMALPWFGRPIGIETLELDSAVLTLNRDAAGFANWQWTDPRLPDGAPMPLVRRVSIPAARVLLKDETRHLEFDGTVTAGEPAPAAGPPPLRIEGAGLLNGRPARFSIDADPLASAAHDKPYRFTFDGQSSGSRLSGGGALPRPFDFRLIDAEFNAAGEDLEDLYFLTGVKLINTGRYRLSGRVTRRGAKTRFYGLSVTSGQSDVQGSLSIDASGGRPKLAIDLDSQTLRLADLGLRAAGRDPQAGPRWLMSDAALEPRSWRRDDTVASLRARRVEVGALPIRDLAATLVVDRGVLTVTPLTGQVFEGALSAHVEADLTTDDPADRIDLKISNLNLARYLPHGADRPLMSGLLQARVLAKGHGRSLHEFAAGADGTVTAAVPRGTIRAALPGLAGLDLRAIGPLLDPHAPEKPLRCAVAGFDARHGVLTSRTLIVDTEPVLIVGEGTIRMDSEAIDLTWRGRPKRPGFRLRSPLLMRGTLLQPSFAIQPTAAAAQGAAAVALGVLLTPLASILAFVDPGLTKDADCGALLSMP